MAIMLIVIFVAIIVSASSIKDSEEMSSFHCPRCNFIHELKIDANPSKYTRHICLKCGGYYYKEVVSNK